MAEKTKHTILTFNMVDIIIFKTNSCKILKFIYIYFILYFVKKYLMLNDKNILIK